METQIVIFLAFISVTVITNTLLIWFVYKGFAGVTSKITETVSEFKTSSETKAWLRMFESASKEAVAVTEATKIQIAEFEPALDRAQQHYLHTLARVDSKLEIAAGEPNTFFARSTAAIRVGGSPGRRAVSLTKKSLPVIRRAASMTSRTE